MAFEEKATWGYLVVTVISVTVYVVIVLAMSTGTPLTDVDYGPVLLWTLGASLVANMFGRGLAAGKGADAKTDARDTDIERFGASVGSWVVYVGVIAALIMAILEWDHFWIANTLYLAGALGAVVISVVRLVAYRRGVPA